MMWSPLFGLCYLLSQCNIPPSTDEILLDSFSSKTAYRHSKLRESENLLTGTRECRLVHINALFRHGTRYPGKDDMEEMEKIHVKIMQSAGYTNLPKSFLAWRSTFSKNMTKQLSSVGYEEMMHLGSRFRNRLSQVYGFIDERKHVTTFATSVLRTQQSAVAFLHKFLRTKLPLKSLLELIKVKDDELRFFDKCPFYTESVLKNKSSKIEYQRFSKGPEIEKIIQDIQKKWKLEDIELTANEIRTLYIMCGYEIANNVSAQMRPFMCDISKEKDALICPNTTKHLAKETSSLCALLDSYHYTVFDYLYDLKHYWTKAYGQRINWLQSCDLMAPMLQQIIQAAEGHQRAVKASDTSNTLEAHLARETYQRAVFWFGHAETVLPFATLLNLFNQSVPMTAEEFKQRSVLINDPEKRFSTFRVSNIAPFSANVALELHHCPNLGKDGKAYFIRVKSNEKTVRWSLANGLTQMSLDDFITHLEICSPKNYNHDEVCKSRSLNTTFM